MRPVSTNRSPSRPAADAPTELLPLEAGPSRATVIRGACWAGIAPEHSPTIARAALLGRPGLPGSARRRGDREQAAREEHGARREAEPRAGSGDRAVARAEALVEHAAHDVRGEREQRR